MLMSILFSGFTKSKVHCCEQHVFIGRTIFHDFHESILEIAVYKKATNVDAQK